MKFAHIINPIKVDDQYNSYLYYSQPITFQSIIDAKQNNIEIYAVNDNNIDIPNPINNLSIKNDHCFRDIIESISDISDIDYFIYTDINMILKPNFYQFINDNIENYDYLAISHEDGIPKFLNNERINSLRPKI